MLGWDRSAIRTYDAAALRRMRPPDLLESLDLLQQVRLRRQGTQILVDAMPT